MVHLAPISGGGNSVVSYAVTVRLDDPGLEGVLPGMTAVATIDSGDAIGAGWLVPTNAIRQEEGSSVVTVVTAEGATSVEITAGDVRGEWTIVESAALQTGDQVRGSVTSFIGEEDEPRLRGVGGGLAGGGGRP